MTTENNSAENSSFRPAPERNYSVLPQKVYDDFLSCVGNHKNVPLRVIRDYVKNNNLEMNGNNLSLIDIIILLRSYAMQYGICGRSDPTFFEPAKTTIIDSLRDLMSLFEAEYFYIDNYKDLPIDDKANKLIKAREVYNKYMKYRE